MPDPKKLSLMDAARKLGLRYRRALDLMLEGKLGESTRDGARWFLTEPGVDAYIAARAKKAKARA